MIFDFIKNHAKIFPIEKMCKVLKVSQSSYYRWKIAAISQRTQKKTVLKKKSQLFILNPNKGMVVHELQYN